MHYTKRTYPQQIFSTSEEGSADASGAKLIQPDESHKIAVIRILSGVQLAGCELMLERRVVQPAPGPLIIEVWICPVSSKLA
jgi:hypothetical protein